MQGINYPELFGRNTGRPNFLSCVSSVAGAIFGAILAVVAGSRYDSVPTARVGALTGALAGGMEGNLDQQNILRNCLNGRGYSVLRWRIQP